MSPGAELKAVIFGRDCGGTGAGSTGVSVLPPAATVRAGDSGNLFVLEADRATATPGSPDAPAVRVQWIGRNRLRIMHDSRARVLKAVPSLAAVRIEYVPWASSGPDTVVVRSGGLSLRALLWRPAGTGPFPGVLFNHGSYGKGELTSYDMSALGPVFAKHGYVFLFLCRRGIGLSSDQGTSDGDLMDSAFAASGQEGRNEIQLQLLDGEELNEALAGLAFLRALPQVDPARITVAGHSFGGSLTLFLTARDSAIRAAVIFSGAAASWGRSRGLRSRLVAAVGHAPPIYFIHAANDYSTEPGKALAAEMQRLKRPHRLTIYPAVGQTTREGHNFLFRNVGMWEGDVFAFLEAIH